MGLPRSISKELDKKINLWAEKSGPAWTVGRLKSIKIDLIRLKGGLPPLLTYRKNRFGEISGVVGWIFRFSQKGPRHFHIALNSLMAYSAFKPGNPRKSHIQSLKENLNAEPVSVFEIPVTCKVRSVTEEDQIPFIYYSGSPSKSAPLFNPDGHFQRVHWVEEKKTKKPDNSVVQSESLFKEHRWLRGHANYRFVTELHPEIYKPILKGLKTPQELAVDEWARTGDFSCLSRPFLPSTSEIVSAGRICGLDKDGGWKIRWIASPHRLHQHALEPMKQRLLEVLVHLPWDCTFDQSKAVLPLQQAFKRGQTVYSLDLSSATDHFPLSFQESILRQLNTEPLWQRYVDLFVSLSRAAWKSDYGWLRWRKGQPMGLGPSFPSFALAHGLLLQHLSHGHRDLFYVLGDDVVILDDELASCYLSVLNQWKVPVSTAKCLISDKVAEFAGKVITSDHVFSGYKWRELDDDNFLIVMKLFGDKFKRMLTARQRRVYMSVRSLQPPWGCNHGLSLEDSKRATREFYTDKTDDLESSTCWSFHRWFKVHGTLKRVASWSIETWRSLQSAFDVKVSSKFRPV
jgi:hypothetical protein